MKYALIAQVAKLMFAFDVAGRLFVVCLDAFVITHFAYHFDCSRRAIERVSQSFQKILISKWIDVMIFTCDSQGAVDWQHCLWVKHLGGMKAGTFN